MVSVLNCDKKSLKTVVRERKLTVHVFVSPMSLLRPLLSRTRVVALNSVPCRICTESNALSSASTSNLPRLRSYASKSKAIKSTATLIPGSQQKLTDDAAIEEYEKAEKKMQSAVEWYRKEVAGLETRASGRVTPALLAPVRVELPDSKGELFRLEDVATIGVREGSMLVVTVFEEHASAPIRLFEGFC